MITTDIVVDGNKTLDQLNNLIKQRSDALKQSVFKATSAIAVTCIKSIRALTRDARQKKKFNIVCEKTSYKVGYSNSDKKPCLRVNSNRHSPKVIPDGRVIFKIAGIHKPEVNAIVFKVTQEKKQLKPIYIACASQKDALDYAEKVTKKRIDKLGTLAKNALSVAIGKIASKSFQLGGSSTSQAKSSTVSQVIETSSNNQYKMIVRDNLDYSTDALKGGQSAIDQALQAAANKSYGTLKHLAGKDFSDKFPTKPFPEVR